MRMDVPTEHFVEIGDEDWYGCEFPERPFDPAHTRFVSYCRSCVLAAQAAELHGYGPNMRHVSLTEFLDYALGRTTTGGIR